MKHKNKAVFFDLQGTLGGEETGDIRQFSFYPFAIDAIKKINNHSLLAIVITNQSNIGRGYLTIEDFNKKLHVLKNQLHQHGAYLDGVYCCPHLREDHCTCKKPLSGLIDKAVEEHAINVKESFLVGDMGMTDMLLSQRVGTKSILVLTGFGKRSVSDYRQAWSDYEPHHIAENVLDAVDWILLNQNNE